VVVAYVTVELLDALRASVVEPETAGEPTAARADAAS